MKGFFKILCALAILTSMRAGVARAEIANHRPLSGFQLYEGESGSVNFRPYTYLRYLNQKWLDGFYTDSFGDVKELDLRQDIQINKVTLYLYGWVFDPRFRYFTYVWTANTSQGLGAQVVVAGNLTFTFGDRARVGGGITSLPGVRSTEGNFPFWLGVDNRLIADEYFRPSYTSGLWVQGALVPSLNYMLMVGNNLSQLGIDAAQLDNDLDTWSGMLNWMPTTGEYGKGFGDFENHERLATRIGIHGTHSTEDRQSQPGTEAPENSQIRISDGNVVFTPGLFGAGININSVRYLMASLDAGFKIRGFALEGELYSRTVDNFRGDNLQQLSFDALHDHGFQVQSSVMLKPQTLQAYVSGSKIFGEYGDPSDVRVGLNFYPWKNQSLRWNNEFIHLNDSPVGALSLPYLVGGDGTLFHSNLELAF